MGCRRDAESAGADAAFGYQRVNATGQCNGGDVHVAVDGFGAGIDVAGRDDAAKRGAENRWIDSAERSGLWAWIEDQSAWGGFGFGHDQLPATGSGDIDQVADEAGGGFAGAKKKDIHIEN